jgi:hypothetical protein
MSRNAPAVIKLRPSDAHRWLVCKASPGYVLQNAHRIPVETFEFTEEGTRAHEAAKQLLTGGKPKYDAGDMRSHVEGYRDFIMKAKGKGDVTLIVESAVKVFYYPGKKGYVDVALIYVGRDGRVKRIHIIDLKYGRGVSVQALENPQLASYCFGLIKDLEDVYQFHAGTEVLITIWQPRISDEPAERTWELTAEELSAFCGTIGDTAEQILKSPYNQPFAPSDDACQFCPAYSFCESRTLWLLGGMEEVIDVELVTPMLVLGDTLPTAAPDELDLPTPASLSADQLSRIMQMKSQFTKWLAKVEDYVINTSLQHDVKYQGFKVVATNPHRKWDDEEQAERFLAAHLGKDVVAPRKLITPSKAVELMKARDRGVRPATLLKLEEMVTRPQGQPTLAPITDPRPEWKDVKAEDEFSDVTLTDEDQSLL